MTLSKAFYYFSILRAEYTIWNKFVRPLTNFIGDVTANYSTEKVTVRGENVGISREIGAIILTLWKFILGEKTAFWINTNIRMT